MSVSVSMPQLGESVTEGTVTRWLKAEGEHVDADEPLLEVSTDKVDTEVPSPASGTVLSIKVQEDETVEIGVELALIGEAGEAGGESAPSGQAEAAPEPEPEPQAQPEPEPQPEPQPQPQAQPEPAQAQSAPSPAPLAGSAPQPAAAPAPEPAAAPEQAPAPAAPAPAA